MHEKQLIHFFMRQISTRLFDDITLFIAINFYHQVYKIFLSSILFRRNIYYTCNGSLLAFLSLRPPQMTLSTVVCSVTLLWTIYISLHCILSRLICTVVALFVWICRIYHPSFISFLSAFSIYSTPRYL